MATTLDIKDAFLMADQPCEERAYVKIEEKVFRLLRCLPGQRTAASQWFQLFSGACKKFKLEQDVMQPTLFMRTGSMYLMVHVDDVFMVGALQTLTEFVMFLKEVKKWKVEAKGPFAAGEKFLYIKMQFKINDDHCDTRCDHKHLFLQSISKDTPDQTLTKKDDSPLLEAEEATKFRSIVGRLMYMAGERPDAQFGIQCLARKMSSPTKQALKTAWRLCSYLQGTIDYGVRMSRRENGRSVMDTREDEEINSGPVHLVEILTDADYAGNRDDRKSTT